MRGARLTALAEQGLVDIWQCTAKRWTAEEADGLLNAIRHAIQQLMVHPLEGAKASVSDGYRITSVNSHVNYFRITTSTAQIVRVLHVRIDPESRLQRNFSGALREAIVCAP